MKKARMRNYSKKFHLLFASDLNSLPLKFQSDLSKVARKTDLTVTLS